MQQPKPKNQKIGNRQKIYRNNKWKGETLEKLSKYTQFMQYILQGISTDVKVVARQKVSIKCTEFNNLYKLLTFFFFIHSRLQFVARVCLLNFMKLQPQQLQAPIVSCICICIFMQFNGISAYRTQSKIKKRKKNQPGDLHTSSYGCRLKIKCYKSCYKYF